MGMENHCGSNPRNRMDFDIRLNLMLFDSFKRFEITARNVDIENAGKNRQEATFEKVRKNLGEVVWMHNN